MEVILLLKVLRDIFLLSTNNISCKTGKLKAKEKISIFQIIYS